MNFLNYFSNLDFKYIDKLLKYGQPFSLTQNTEAIKVNTDKSDLKKLSAFQYMT